MGTWESGNEKLCATSCVAHDIPDILNVSVGPSLLSLSIDWQNFGGGASSLFSLSIVLSAHPLTCTHESAIHARPGLNLLILRFHSSRSRTCTSIAQEGEE